MEKILNGGINPGLIGISQSVVLTAYCALVGAFIFYVGDSLPRPGFFGIFLMLVLLVFSAAVTGSLVFGLPVYLVLKNKIKEALSVFGYTLLFSFIIIIVIIITLFSAT